MTCRPKTNGTVKVPFVFVSLLSRSVILARPIARFQAELLELAVEVGAFQAGTFGHAGHAAVFAHQVVLEIGALEGVARFPQRQVEGDVGGIVGDLAEGRAGRRPMV